MSLFRRVSIPLALALAPAARAEDFGWPSIIGATELVASGPRSGLALSGYDPVAYLVEEQARPGLPEFEASFGGLAWRFASRANREAFLRDPAAFQPRTGGYDAVAAAGRRVASADPLLFAVREGRLYLFRTEEHRRRFLDDADSARAAEDGWAQVRAGLVSE